MGVPHQRPYGELLVETEGHGYYHNIDFNSVKYNLVCCSHPKTGRSDPKALSLTFLNRLKEYRDVAVMLVIYGHPPNSELVRRFIEDMSLDVKADCAYNCEFTVAGGG
jgi:hypothetical protein